MYKQVRNFLKEEDGLGTVEIVIIIAVLVGLALIFKKQVYNLVDKIFDKIFSNTKEPVANPGDEYLKKKSIG